MTLPNPFQDELATFNVEAHSSLVLQLLQFMHTGCVFNVKTEPHTEGMSLELCSLLRNFGIDYCLVLKQSQRVEALTAPDLAQFTEVGKLEEEGSGIKGIGKEGGEGRDCDDDFAFSVAAAAVEGGVVQGDFQVAQGNGARLAAQVGGQRDGLQYVRVFGFNRGLAEVAQ